MNNEIHAIALRHMEDLQKKVEPLRLPVIPAGGWLKATRQALGMPLSYVAKKIGVKPPTLAGIEAAEIDQSVSIKTARRVAEAMDCVFVYAVIPRVGLRQMLEQQAERKADELLRPVARGMMLEEQAVDREAQDRQRRRLKETLLQKPAKLWR